MNSSPETGKEAMEACRTLARSLQEAGHSGTWRVLMFGQGALAAHGVCSAPNQYDVRFLRSAQDGESMEGLPSSIRPCPDDLLWRDLSYRDMPNNPAHVLVASDQDVRVEAVLPQAAWLAVHLMNAYRPVESDLLCRLLSGLPEEDVLQAVHVMAQRNPDQGGLRFLAERALMELGDQRREGATPEWVEGCLARMGLPDGVRQDLRRAFLPPSDGRHLPPGMFPDDPACAPELEEAPEIH